MPKQFSELASQELSYRIPMRVSAVRYLFDGVYGSTVYPICPQCNSTMERDYQKYCDRCGQALDWNHYPHTLIIFANTDS